MSIVIFFLMMRILRSTLSSVGKESACNAAGLGSIPGLGRSPGEENSCPPQYSDLENPMDSMVHGVYSPWGCKESDMAETLFLATFKYINSIVALLSLIPHPPHPCPLPLVTTCYQDSVVSMSFVVLDLSHK